MNGELAPEPHDHIASGEESEDADEDPRMTKIEELARAYDLPRHVIEKAMQRAGGKQEFIELLPQMQEQGMYTDVTVQEDGKLVRENRAS